jgi:hypothetical protein
MTEPAKLPPRTIAIAQPTFLPWLGWFDLADQVELLILLDDVPFSKQSWQQRNRVQTAQGLSYVTVPVRTSGRLGQRIADTELADTAFVARLLRTIATNYGRAPYFARYFEAFGAMLHAAAAPGRLAELNIGCIEWLAAELGVATPRVRSSIMDVAGTRGEHVARLCEHAGAGHYLSPAGARDYLLEDHASFDQRGISISLQVYEHPVYRQCFQPFQPFASALDLLFNAGPEAGAVMRSGRRAPQPLEQADADGKPV